MMLSATETIEKKVPEIILSRVSQDESLLAPRGVAVAGPVMAVSDTAHNRVFIWKDYGYLNGHEPDIVLGQSDLENKARNAGTGVDAASLHYPSGVWTDGERIIVADAWNHRVLIWNRLPESNGCPADIVVGQRDFGSNLPNSGYMNKGIAGDTLYWPYGVISDGRSLWIADTGNRRILFFERIPVVDFTPADGVIGQADLEQREFDHFNATWPYSVKLGPRGELAVVDTQYYRVLLWKDRRDAFRTKADIIMGQADFEQNGQNQYHYLPGQNTLNWCYDCVFDENGIWVADTANSRLLRWNELPSGHNAPADELIGQPGFAINGESSLSMNTSLQNEMYWPFSVAYDQGRLFVADTGNHRILIYKT